MASNERRGNSYPGGHQNVQSSHSQQRTSYSHSARSQGGSTFQPQQRANNGVNQTTPTMTQSVTPNQNQNMGSIRQMGHHYLAQTSHLHQQAVPYALTGTPYGATVPYYTANQYTGYPFHTIIQMPNAHFSAVPHVQNRSHQGSAANPTYPIASQGVPNNTENTNFPNAEMAFHIQSPSVPHIPNAQQLATPTTPVSTENQLKARKKCPALIQDPNTMEVVNLTDLQSSGSGPSSESTSGEKSSQSRPSTEKPQTVSAERALVAPATPASTQEQQEFMDKISSVALPSTQASEPTSNISASEVSKKSEGDTCETHKNGAHKTSDSVHVSKNSRRNVQEENLRNETQTSTNSTGGDIVSAPIDSKLMNQEKPSTDVCGKSSGKDSTNVPTREKTSPSTEQNVVQAQVLKTSKDAASIEESAKSAQSHNLGKSGDIQRAVKLRKEDERPSLTFQGDSHRASPTQDITSSKKDSQPIDTTDKTTSANDASKRPTDDISKDFGKSSENEEPKSVSISEASNKDEIKSNEEEPSSSEISDGNKSDNSVLSSDNTSDKKREYDAEFLRSLQNSKQALQKPALNLKGSGPRIYDTPLKERQENDNRFRAPLDNFLPSYMSHANQPPRKQYPDRPKHKPKVIAVNIPMSQEDVVLHQTDNAWKPAAFKAEPKESEEVKDDKQTEELLRKFRGILNKLTPQKFDNLIKQIEKLGIDTKERLDQILNLIFDKALSEPAFCVEYAKVCKHLSTLNPYNKDNEQNLDGKSGDKEKTLAKFRVLLLSKCQLEFNTDMYQGIDIEGKTQAIEALTDPEAKKTAEAELDDEKRKARKRWLGLIRFIGELYMLNLLSGVIIHECLYKLLSNQDDESLECLCTLLRTIGLKFENQVRTISENSKPWNNRQTAPPNLEEFFRNLEYIIRTKPAYTSSRVRFMLQDVLDMRKDGWRERKIQNENKPKTREELNREMKDEEVTNQLAMQSSQGRKTISATENWNMNNMRDSAEARSQFIETMSSLKKYGNEQRDNISLVPTTALSWGSGARVNQAAKAQAEAFSSNSNNGRDRSNQRSSGSRDSSKHRTPMGSNQNRSFTSQNDSQYNTYRVSNPPMRPVTIEPFSERYVAKKDTKRSNSVEKKPTPEPKTNSVPKESPKSEMPVIPKNEPSPNRERSVEQAFEEFFEDELSKEEIVKELATEEKSTYLRLGLYTVLNLPSQKFDKSFEHFVHLFRYLMDKKIISFTHFKEGFESILDEVEDLVIDFPKLHLILANLLNNILDQGMANTLPELLKKGINNGSAAIIVYHLIDLKDSSKFQLNDLGWSAFLPENVKAEDFFKEKKLVYRSLGTSSANKSIDSKVDTGNIESLCKYIEEVQDGDSLSLYISKNFDDVPQKSSPIFISALIKAITGRCLRKDKDNLTFNDELFKRLIKVLPHTVTISDTLALQSLFALEECMKEHNYSKSHYCEILTILRHNVGLADGHFLDWAKKTTSKNAISAVDKVLKQIREATDSDC